MKKLLLVFLVAVVLAPACHKSEELAATTSNAIIIGMDSRKCACCWGWIIEIDNTTYKFDKIPAGSSIDLNNLVYPVPVTVTWRNPQGLCGYPLIEIVSITQ